MTARFTSFTSCTLTMEAPFNTPAETAANVPSNLSFSGKLREEPINDFLDGPIKMGH